MINYIYKPSKRVKKHIADWEKTDFVQQNKKFGGDAIGHKATEFNQMFGKYVDLLGQDTADALFSTYYNLSPNTFEKKILPQAINYAKNPNAENYNILNQTLVNRWTWAQKRDQRGIKRRAKADANLAKPVIKTSDYEAAGSGLEAPVDNTRVYTANLIKPIRLQQNLHENSNLESKSYLENNIPVMLQKPKSILPNIIDVFENLHSENQLPLQPINPFERKFNNGKDEKQKENQENNILVDTETGQIYNSDVKAYVDENGYIQIMGSDGKYHPHTRMLNEVKVTTRDPKKYSSAFQGNQEYLDDLVSFVPIAGDLQDIYDVGNDLINGRYFQALVGSGLLALPNIVQKPLKWVGKNMIMPAAMRTLNPVISKLPNWTTIKYGYYPNKAPHDLRSTYLKDMQELIGSKIGEGGESYVYNSKNKDYVIKDKSKIYGTQMEIEDLDALRENINHDLSMNMLPQVEPSNYLGFKSFIDRNGNIQFTPIYSQKKIIPSNKVKMDAFDRSLKSSDEYFQSEYLKNPGVTYDDAEDVFKYGNLKFSDLSSGNFGFKEDGSIVLIDPMMFNHGKDHKIHIKKQNRGKFTSVAKQNNMGVQQFAKKVLNAPKGKYSTILRKRANFALQAARWHK